MDNCGNNYIKCFYCGVRIRCEDITLLGIIILLNRWDKMQNKLNQYMRCCTKG